MQRFLNNPASQDPFFVGRASHKKLKASLAEMDAHLTKFVGQDVAGQKNGIGT